LGLGRRPTGPGERFEEYRESNAPDAFDAAVSLLKGDGRLPLPIELEVEISKMVVRKLTANPPAERDRHPELASRLEELVDCTGRDQAFHWHVRSPERADELTEPDNHPQPSWFFPFVREKIM